jgi:ABC-type enterobactin transport system permease subunit
MSTGTKHVGGAATFSWPLARWATVAMLLILPLAAMQFTDEVAWTGFDFAAAAALLIGAGAIYEVARRVLHDTRLRRVIGAALVGLVLVVWAEGAVGIF